MPTKRSIWKRWVDEYVDVSDPTPLLETNSDNRAITKEYGKNDRDILKRSQGMNEDLRDEATKVVEDYHAEDDTYEGLIYMMYRLRDGDLVPLYIGKAGKYGKDGERLSANLRNFEDGRSSTAKFARWGDGYAYHIGNLSAVVLDHSDDKKSGNYCDWADRIFDDGLKIDEPTYFWTKAWRHDDTGLYYDFEVSLEHLEYQLIGMAADLYGDRLLNREGT
jgi:hypothetical protein